MCCVEKDWQMWQKKQKVENKEMISLEGHGPSRELSGSLWVSCYFWKIHQKLKRITCRKGGRKGGRKGDVILFILTGYIHLLTTVCDYKHTWYPGSCVLTSLIGALCLNKGTIIFEHVKMASICYLMWFFMISLKTAEEESNTSL